MSSNVVNQVAYIQTSRKFPTEINELCVQINKAYIDIANAVNARTIGIFSTNRPAITGESWFLNKNQRQQTLRQVYTITSFAAFNHGINLATISTFTKITGIGFDGTNYYPLPFVFGTNPVSNVGITISPTQVVFTLGAGPPGIVSGFVVLEWLSNF